MNIPKILEYSSPQVDIMESTAQRNLMHCGVGSGKSHVIGTLSIEYVINNPEVRGFIGANSYSQLTKSTLDRVFKVWEEDFGFVKGRHYVVDHIPPDSFKKIGPALKSYENTISFNNGAIIFTASLDNYKMIDGTEFGWAMLDETKDTKEEAVKEVIVARLRQVGMFIDKGGVIWKESTLKEKVIKKIFSETSDEEGKWYVNEKGDKLNGFNPLYIFTSPAKAKWLMNWFDLSKQAEAIEAIIYRKGEYYRKRIGDKLVVIASTYHNIHNLSKGYVDRLIADVGSTPGLVSMLVYGSPFGKTGGEFYSAYQRLKHVKKFDPWEDAAVHLAFDFNLVPYITCTAWQVRYDKVTKRYKVRCFREYCLKNPKNNAEALANEIKNTIPHLLKNGVFIYGDYSGKTQDTISNDIRTEFDMIEKVLKQYRTNTWNRVVQNALHVRRRDFMNKMYSGGFNVDIEIEEHCTEMIGDLEFVKESPSGGKLKAKITAAGKTFEEHGHTSDSQDYLFCSMFENLFNG